MVICPLCGERVERLHPIPPEVVTRELLSTAGGADRATSLEGRAECIERRMDGGPPS